MNYNLTISEHNQEAHIDIEHDIQKQQNGLFTFILRINRGDIVDYNVIEYADIRKYLVLKKVIVEEFIVSRHTPVGGEPAPLRTDNGQRAVEERGGPDRHDQYSQVKA